MIRLRPSLSLFVVIAVATGLGLAGLDILVLHPGLGAPEELQNLGMIQSVAEHCRGWFRFGGGAWTRSLQALFLAGPWGWQAIYSVNALALGLAGWGLWRMAASLDSGEGGAAWALALALAAPFSFLQARTTFAYVPAPAWLLGLALGLRSRRGPVASAVLGFLAATVWLDYEAWALAFPVLALAWGSAAPQERAKGSWALVGWLGGLAGVLGLSWPYGADWWSLRGHPVLGLPTSPFLGRLRSYFLGGSSPQAMGLEDVATVPWAAWPGLLVGLWVAPGWLWAWAVIGLGGLAAAGPWQEPNRAIVAWPALLLISGLGSAWLWRRWPDSLRPWILGLALLVAPWLGFRGFQSAETQWDEGIHGYSRRVALAADYLMIRSRETNILIGPELDPIGGPLLSRILKGCTGLVEGPHSETWVLVPNALADGPDARWGQWRAFQDSPKGPTLWLLRPSTKVLQWLQDQADAASQLGRLSELPVTQRLERLRGDSPPPSQAWAWTCWRAARLRTALALGCAQASDVVPLLEGPCLDRSVLETLSAALERPQPGVAALARAKAATLARPGERWRLAGID